MTRSALPQLLGVVLLCGCSTSSNDAFRAQYQQALREYQSGNRTAAIAEFRAALRLKPDSAEAHGNLGAALYDVGESDAAIQEYRQALRLNPAAAEVHNNLGVALLARGETVAAVSEYRQAVVLRPDFAEAQYNLCLGLELLGQLAEALTHCRIAARQDPGRLGVPAAVERLEKKLAAP